MPDRTSHPLSNVMWKVNAALAPAGLAAIYIFGISSLGLILVSILTAMVTEALIQKVRNQKIVLSDGSAFMTGLLLAYTLPATSPWGMASLGSFFAIAIAKQAFGGFGKNIFNPALAGRAFLMTAWPSHMVFFPKPFACDAITQATPLSLLKEGKVASIAEMGLSYKDLFLGNRGGCLGEVCILALLLGGLYLLVKKIITWHIPLSFIALVAAFTWVFGSKDGFFKGDFLLHILSGGLMLGAFYMATDYVTSPVTKKGQLIFGIGCGFLTSVLRLWGGFPEGVCYAILAMNAAVPLINKITRTSNP